MADVKLLTPFILKWEGGFVDDKDDLGGATNMGVTIATYKEYCKRKGCPEPTIEKLRMLKEDEWTEILKTMYWNRWCGDKISNQSIANILVDWVWASGVHGIKIPQKILGVASDGVVGKITIEKVNSYLPQAELFREIQQARFDFVDRICKSRSANEKFRKGWNNRIEAFKFSDKL